MLLRGEEMGWAFSQGSVLKRLVVDRTGKFVAAGLMVMVFLAECDTGFISLARAADTNSEAQWFTTLVQANNGRSFCVPPNTPLRDVAIALQQYMKMYQAGDTLTAPAAVQMLAQIYPCAASGGGKTVVVPQTGVYATIDTRETISTIQRLAATKGHENDALVDNIEKHADHYQPPVFFSLATLLYRQGNRDGAIFWLNAGRLRADYDAVRCTDVTARSAVQALVLQVPEELKKDQFSDLPKLKKIIDDMIKWDAATPHNYDQRWINLHGMAAMNEGLGNQVQSQQPLSVPEEQWAALAQKTRDDYQRSAEKTISDLSKQPHK